MDYYTIKESATCYITWLWRTVIPRAREHQGRSRCGKMRRFYCFQACVHKSYYLDTKMHCAYHGSTNVCIHTKSIRQVTQFSSTFSLCFIEEVDEIIILNPQVLISSFLPYCWGKWILDVCWSSQLKKKNGETLMRQMKKIHTQHTYECCTSCL